MSNVTVSPKCGVVVEAAVTGDPVGDAVTRYGPVIEDDEALPAKAVPASARETAIVADTAILLNT
jgi:hypothetical protein